MTTIKVLNYSDYKLQTLTVVDVYKTAMEGSLSFSSSYGSPLRCMLNGKIGRIFAKTQVHCGDKQLILTSRQEVKRQSVTAECFVGTS